MRFAAVIAAILVSLGSVSRAQERDFLTDDEIDQVRVTQDPNERLALYLQFAQARVELVRQLIAKPKPGRTLLIHDTLEDYTKIIEAIDTVGDDALKRKIDISKGMALVKSGEKDMAVKLAKMEENPSQDYSRYEFAMQQALEATQDSADLSGEDLQQRAADVNAASAKDKQERESVMTAKEVSERKEADQKVAPNGGRKIPTLLKPGEKAQVQ